jgi:hypothetical protein
VRSPPSDGGARAWPRPPWTFGSGPTVARLFGALFALVSLAAWLSLGAQVRQLVGSRGLLPVGDLVDAAREAGVATWTRLPTLFLWTQSDGALVAGVFAGAALSLAALVDFKRRACFALSTVLYLSYATAGRVFLSFQWDNLLLEAGLLAAFLPTTRAAPLGHFLLRALLFKLYFESGLAKWQSPLGDWRDGSAMTFYYETAPLPTALAFYAHHLPAWWHHLESRATLVLELVVPLAIFGPRRARLGAAAALTGFQLVNAATANYGFFCYLAAALHVFLLDDGDLARLGRLGRWPARAPGAAPAEAPAAAAPATPTPAPARTPAPLPLAADPLGLSAADGRALVRLGAGLGAGLYVALSLAQAAFTFGGGEPGPLLTALAPLAERADTFRVVNTYHLFAAITRERIEPELQTLDDRPADGDGRVRHDGALDDGAAWTAHELWHKPGAPDRRPDLVAPHQPRLDFQLWFHGLGHARARPPYVHVLLDRMCEDAAAVQAFFRDPLPARPRAVRVVYWRYHFATMTERRETGAWWRRERVAATPPVRCAAEPSPR